MESIINNYLLKDNILKDTYKLVTLHKKDFNKLIK